MADMNARCQSRAEFIDSNDDCNLPELSAVSELYLDDDNIANFHRNNIDLGSNKYGDSLINLCRTVNLRFLNGKKVGVPIDVRSYTMYPFVSLRNTDMVIKANFGQEN